MKSIVQIYARHCSIMHQNVQCIRNKIEHIKVLLKSEDVSIVCLTIIHNYNLCSIYYRFSFKNGGIAIFCKNSFENYVRELDYIKNYSIEKTFEICGIKLRLTDISFIVLVIYRSTSGDLVSVCKHNVPMIVCGDLNIDQVGTFCCKK